MQRQAITISIEQLRNLADSLEKELKETKDFFHPKPEKVRHQVNIINKTNESDTWELE